MILFPLISSPLRILELELSTANSLIMPLDKKSPCPKLTGELNSNMSSLPTWNSSKTPWKNLELQENSMYSFHLILALKAFESQIPRQSRNYSMAQKIYWAEWKWWTRNISRSVAKEWCWLVLNHASEEGFRKSV